MALVPQGARAPRGPLRAPGRAASGSYAARRARARGRPPASRCSPPPAPPAPPHQQQQRPRLCPRPPLLRRGWPARAHAPARAAPRPARPGPPPPAAPRPRLLRPPPGPRCCCRRGRRGRAGPLRPPALPRPRACHGQRMATPRPPALPTPPTPSHQREPRQDRDLCPHRPAPRQQAAPQTPAQAPARAAGRRPPRTRAAGWGAPRTRRAARQARGRPAPGAGARASPAAARRRPPHSARTPVQLRPASAPPLARSPPGPRCACGTRQLSGPARAGPTATGRITMGAPYTLGSK
jgi:hypothetical protein